MCGNGAVTGKEIIAARFRSILKANLQAFTACAVVVVGTTMLDIVEYLIAGTAIQAIEMIVLDLDLFYR